MQDAFDQCPGCLAAVGQSHGDDCGHARCPDCGAQLLTHECEVSPDGWPDRPALWHGVDQSAEMAWTLRWWTTATGIDHLVEDHTRVLVAVALGQITWDQEAQRYVIVQIDEAVLDDHVRHS